MCLRWGLLDGKNSESLPDALHYASLAVCNVHLFLASHMNLRPMGLTELLCEYLVAVCSLCNVCT